jgi:hypothetical protein
MKRRDSAGISFLCTLLLVGGCGEEIAEEQMVPDQPPEKPACQLIRQVDLQQIFVNSLTPDAKTADSNHQCTWIDDATKEPFVRYELLPYREDLKARVASIEQEHGASINPRFVQGIGDAAVWTDDGLFANRSGRTLQVQPLQDNQEKAPYQELARLLLTRLEEG